MPRLPLITLFCSLYAVHAVGQSPTAPPASPASTAALSIDASSPTGEVRHGATGWLYGQSEPGIPPTYMMELLKPRIAAQKPPAGLQHPGGDALEVMPGFKAAGGKMMQIYIQDVYPDWPYNDRGLDDYMAKVAEVARKVVADPNRTSYVYVPFNEPDNNWYGYSGPKFDRFLHDWLAVYREIRSIDSAAKIAGPNYEHLKPATYEAFFTFARDNHALPDETTWHELHEDFFTGWYARYEGYRAMEKRLGIAPIPVVINEYARDRGDLAVPGNLVQWITRLENSKVDGCLAFWTPAGTMADLTARSWPNRATGAWWVYDWYAEMTGQTLTVAPPDRNAFGLQGIASADSEKKQVRVLFGGTGDGVDLNFTGLTALAYFGNAAHLSLWRVDSSGIEPSLGPELVSNTDLPIADGRAHFRVAKADAASAYYAVLTPTPANSVGEKVGGHPAIYAVLSGGAEPTYGVSPGTVTGFRTGAAATFPITTDSDGYYTLTWRYTMPAHGVGKAALFINDARARAIDLAAPKIGWPWAEANATLFLAGGINAVKFGALPGPIPGLGLVSLSLAPASGPISTYMAVDPKNEMRGGAATGHDADGRSWVSLPANGDAASLRFHRVAVASAGRYKLIVTYSNDEKGHKGTVDEFAHVVVNGGVAADAYFRQTFGASLFCTKAIDTDLKAGDNTIEIAAVRGHRGPTVERIQIAKADLN